MYPSAQRADLQPLPPLSKMPRGLGILKPGPQSSTFLSKVSMPSSLNPKIVSERTDRQRVDCSLELQAVPSQHATSPVIYLYPNPGC